MSTKLKIRKADLNDFNTIYGFVNELEETEFQRDKIRAAFEFNISNPDNIYLIAEMDNDPIGYLSCHSQFLLHHEGQKIAEIQEMFIRSTNRKMGIGKRMIDELKLVASELGIHQLEVTSNNRRTATHRFYEREDFTQSHKKFTWRVR